MDRIFSILAAEFDDVGRSLPDLRCDSRSLARAKLVQFVDGCAHRFFERFFKTFVQIASVFAHQDTRNAHGLIEVGIALQAVFLCSFAETLEPHVEQVVVEAGIAIAISRKRNLGLDMTA